MKIVIPVGSYRIVGDKRITLSAGPAGVGVILGALGKDNPFLALAFFLFPHKNQTVSVEDTIVFSGEELLEYFWEELHDKIDQLKRLTWVIAGASKYLSGLSELDLAKKNLSLARIFLKKRVGVESFYEFVFKPSYVMLEIDGRTPTIRIVHNGGITCL